MAPPSGEEAASESVSAQATVAARVKALAAARA
jgi:hypothetical protein